MAKKIAKEYFLGIGDKRRMTCAQAVATAFKGKFKLREEDIANLKAVSGGRAPGGLCGALYAVRVLFREGRENQFQFVHEEFVRQAGSDQCRVIRAARKIGCAECVEIAAGLVEKNLS